MPDKTSSVVELVPNNEVALSTHHFFYLLVRRLLSKLFTVARALAMQVCGLRSGFEIAGRIQIVNQTRTCGPPSKTFLRQCAGSRNVVTDQEPEPTEVFGGLLSGFSDDRYLQAPSDCLSDFSKRHAFFCDRVIAGSC